MLLGPHDMKLPCNLIHSSSLGDTGTLHINHQLHSILAFL